MRAAVARRMAEQQAAGAALLRPDGGRGGRAREPDRRAEGARARRARHGDRGARRAPAWRRCGSTRGSTRCGRREGLLEAEEVNVGVAIALDDGLIAPALLGPTRSTWRAPPAALRDLVQRARAGRLRPPELTDATFTLSNLGMFDVTAFTAIVTPPQVAILATGAAGGAAALVAGARPVSLLTATLSADHRAVDGADAARFLETFKQRDRGPRLAPAEPSDWRRR